MDNYISFKEHLLGIKQNKITCVWWLNIGIEQIWSATEGDPIIPRLSIRESDNIASKSEQMCLMIADHNDIVILKDRIPLMVTESLKTAGLSLPEVWVLPENDKETQASISEIVLKNCDIMGRLSSLNQKSGNIFLTPYAATSADQEIANQTGCRIIGASPEAVIWTNNKINARLLAIESGLPVTEGFICKSVEEILLGIERLRGCGSDSIVIKDAYGSSGKGLYIIDSEKAMDFFSQILLRKKNSGKYISVIVEKWYNTKANISFTIFIREDGTIVYIPPKKQILKGVIYRGCEFPIDHILNRTQLDFYEKSANLLGRNLYKRGYRGVATIDSIVTNDNTVFPMIEINGRFGMTTYISFTPAWMKNARFFASRYYNVNMNSIPQKIINNLQKNNYTPEKGEGIIVYSYAAKINALPGRIFILYAYNDLFKLHNTEKWIAGFFR